MPKENSKKFSVIVVTGTPGTGKTTLSKKIAERGYEYMDVNKVIEEHSLQEGYDKKRDAKIIDTDKLNDVLIDMIKRKKNLVIDSHLSHYLPKAVVDLCIVTKCQLKELSKRLVARGYSEEKVRENLDAEIFDTCRTEAEEAGHNVVMIWTDKDVDIQLKDHI